MSLSLLLCPMPVGIGMHSSLKTTMLEPITHVLSTNTCSFAESRLSHGQRSPPTSLHLNICGTSSGDASEDGLPSYRTSTTSLMHSRRNGAGSSKQPQGGSSRAWRVVISRAWWRMGAQLAIETSVKLLTDPCQTRRQAQITWLIKNIVLGVKYVV